MAEIVLSVPDISCDHCKHTIEQTLGPLAGVESVAVDVDGKRVRLQYDARQTDLAAIQAALEEEGYPVAG